MLPAIAVILWCNLLAVLSNGYLKTISIDSKGRRQQAQGFLVVAALVTLVPASWQTFEVIRAGVEAREKVEQIQRRSPFSWEPQGLPSQRSSGAKPNRNLP